MPSVGHMTSFRDVIQAFLSNFTTVDSLYLELAKGPQKLFEIERVRDRECSRQRESTVESSRQRDSLKTSEFLKNLNFGFTIRQSLREGVNKRCANIDIQTTSFCYYKKIVTLRNITKLHSLRYITFIFQVTRVKTLPESETAYHLKATLLTLWESHFVALQ